MLIKTIQFFNLNIFITLINMNCFSVKTGDPSPKKKREVQNYDSSPEFPNSTNSKFKQLDMDSEVKSM